MILVASSLGYTFLGANRFLAKRAGHLHSPPRHRARIRKAVHVKECPIKNKHDVPFSRTSSSIFHATRSSRSPRVSVLPGVPCLALAARGTCSAVPAACAQTNSLIKPDLFSEPAPLSCSQLFSAFFACFCKRQPRLSHPTSQHQQQGCASKTVGPVFLLRNPRSPHNRASAFDRIEGRRQHVGVHAPSLPFC